MQEKSGSRFLRGVTIAALTLAAVPLVWSWRGESRENPDALTARDWPTMAADGTPREYVRPK